MAQWNTVIWGFHGVYLPSPASLLGSEILEKHRNMDIKNEGLPHSEVLQKLLIILQPLFTLMVYLFMKRSSTVIHAGVL